MLRLTTEVAEPLIKSSLVWRFEFRREFEDLSLCGSWTWEANRFPKNFLRFNFYLLLMLKHYFHYVQIVKKSCVSRWEFETHRSPDLVRSFWSTRVDSVVLEVFVWIYWIFSWVQEQLRWLWWQWLPVRLMACRLSGPCRRTRKWVNLRQNNNKNNKL